VITTSDYLARPKLFAGAERAKLINLSRSYNYQSKGYYASLLAEARGHRVIPTVETMLELREHKLYEYALPDLEEALSSAAIARGRASIRHSICCSASAHAGPPVEAFGRLLFDWYRCPALEVTISAGKRWKIDRLRARPLAKLGPEEVAFFRTALHQHSQARLAQSASPHDRQIFVAVLYDPQEELPPSSVATLQYFQRFAERHSVEIELITKPPNWRNWPNSTACSSGRRLPIDNYTYRFARRALQEGMPVIDDPVSMIRCTNKVYLHELMERRGVPIPPTLMLAEEEDWPKPRRPWAGRWW